MSPVRRMGPPVTCASVQPRRSGPDKVQLQTGWKAVSVGGLLGRLIGEDQPVGVQAARIQAESEPDGICVSERVYHDLANHRWLAFVSVGQRRLKGVKRPVGVYLLLDPELGGWIGESASSSAAVSATSAPSASTSGSSSTASGS